MENFTPTPQLSIIIPVFGNASVLNELYIRLKKILADQMPAYEIIFVNDASPDHSLALLKKLTLEDPHVAVISLQKNCGQHFALLVGLLYARGNYFILMDADLQDPPEIIPKLFATITHTSGQFAAVYAKRYGAYESWPRLLTSYIFKQLLTWLCKMPSKVGSFVILDSRVRQKLLALNIKKPYVTGMIMCAHLPVTSIPFHRKHSDSKSSYTMRKRVKMGFVALSSILLLKFKKNIDGKKTPLWQQHIPSLEFYGKRFLYKK